MSETGKARTGDTSQTGTTLVEALVVVTITALVALIGFPQLQREILTLSQRQTVSEVAARLRMARAAAQLRDGPVMFAIAANGRAYGASGGQTTVAPPGVTLTASAAGTGRIVFYGDGSSTGGQVLVTAARRAIPVTIARQTGLVKIGGA